MKYEIGDIVFVSKYKYTGGKDGENHLFVIIDNDDNLVPIEYFGMLVSSRVDKSKDRSPYEFNEPLKKNTNNGLKVDSIVKCDEVYNIPAKNIAFKIGQVDIDDFMRFMDAYKIVLERLEKELEKA